MWPACLGTQWHCSAKSVGGQNPPSPGRGQTRTSLTRTTARPPTPSPPGKLIAPPWETSLAPWCSPCSGSLASGGREVGCPGAFSHPNTWSWWGEKWSTSTGSSGKHSHTMVCQAGSCRTAQAATSLEVRHRGEGCPARGHVPLSSA